MTIDVFPLVRLNLDLVISVAKPWGSRCESLHRAVELGGF